MYSTVIMYYLQSFRGGAQYSNGGGAYSHIPLAAPPPPIGASPYPHHTPAYWYHHGILLHITEQSFLFQSSQDCLSSFKPWHALWAMKTRHQSHDLQHEEHMTTHTSHMCTYTHHKRAFTHTHTTNTHIVHLELWADICDAPTVIHHLNEGQSVPHPHLVVIVVMGWGHLHCSRTKAHIHKIVSNDGKSAVT